MTVPANCENLRHVTGVFAARLRDAMADAGIESAAELERAWIARFGGTEMNVHRTVMRLLNSTERPQKKTADRLAELTGKPPEYFRDGLRPLSDLPDADRIATRLGELAELAVANEATLRELRDAIEDHDNLLQDHASALEAVRGGLEARLDQLESRVNALER